MVQWNIDGERILSEGWIGPTRFPFLNNRSPKGYSWEDGRLTKAQVTSRPENDLARCVVVYFQMCSTESKAAIIQNACKKLEFPLRRHRQDTDAESCNVKRKRLGDP